MLDEKRVLRARMRAERDAFAMTSDAVILPPAAFLDRLRPGVVVASYIPMGSEADPSHLAAAVRDAGATLVLPWVAGREGVMRFLAWTADDPLVRGPLGVRQPRDDATELAPAIVLTPLVAFDDALNRLGQGAGHYDRAFAAHPAAWRVGVAWAMQQLLAIDTDLWDVPLHAVITEKGLTA